MSFKIFFSFLFFLVVFFLLGFYWMFQYGEVDFSSYSSGGSSNFSLSNQGAVQFYDNMRFSEKEISYSIDDCPLKKMNDAEYAFEIISNKTILNLYPVSSGEQISVTCDSNVKFDDKNHFIAGEGGPSKIIESGDFNVILKGEILLIRDSKCATPNIAIHEAFHALGFDHSQNPGSIMYNVTKCNQEIGEDLIKAVNEIYSYESYEDLAFNNVSSKINGRYLDANMTVTNRGLQDAEESILKIFADEKEIHEIEVDSIRIGHGVTISLSNVFVSSIGSPKELRFVILYEGNELQKNNNEIILKTKI